MTAITPQQFYNLCVELRALRVELTRFAKPARLASYESFLCLLPEREMMDEGELDA